MGLDVYVGPLLRYYAGDWETVIEVALREQGIDVEVVRPDSGDGDVDREALAADYASWRQAFGDALGVPLDWRDDPAGAYWTDKPAWDAYGSLQVLAASLERGERVLPTLATDDWTDEQIWCDVAASTAARFAHLYLPELWLPIDADVIAEADEVTGNRLVVGSSLRLLEHLEEINAGSYAATQVELDAWLREGAGPDGGFGAAARFGLAVMLTLARISVREQLPMRLDY